VFISAGASIPGVSWKIMRTPSITTSSMFSSISRVGRINPVVPAETALPIDWSTWP